jgi:hypothetical protein
LFRQNVFLISCVIWIIRKYQPDFPQKFCVAIILRRCDSFLFVLTRLRKGTLGNRSRTRQENKCSFLRSFHATCQQEPKTGPCLKLSPHILQVENVWVFTCILQTSSLRGACPSIGWNLWDEAFSNFVYPIVRNFDIYLSILTQMFWTFVTVSIHRGKTACLESLFSPLSCHCTEICQLMQFLPSKIMVDCLPAFWNTTLLCEQSLSTYGKQRK